MRAVAGPRAWLTLNLAAGPWAAWLWAGLLVLALRIVLGAVLAGTWLALRPYLPVPASAVAGAGSALAEALAGVWVRWDAVHYLRLAEVGYHGVSVGDTVFYPLYPLAVHLASVLMGGQLALAGLLVSTLAAVAALAGLYRLTERHYGTPAAQWAVVALAVYPTALFLVAPFTEALFLALTVWAFAAAEDARWLWAGLLAGLAALTRGPGVLTVAALAWLAWEQWRGRPAGAARRSFTLRAAVGVALAGAGALAFLVYRQANGWPPVNAVLRAYSSVELLDPVRGVYYALVQVFTAPALGNVLDLASAVLFGGVLVAMLARPRWRVGAWLMYFGLNLLFDISKHTLNAGVWQSLARYVLVLFPAFIVAGDALARRSRRVRFVYLTLSSVGLLVLSALYALWFFVG